MLNPAVSPHSVSSSPPRVPFVQLSRRVSLGRANLTVLRYQLPKMDLELLHNHPQLGQQSDKKPANQRNLSNTLSIQYCIFVEIYFYLGYVI